MRPVLGLALALAALAGCDSGEEERQPPAPARGAEIRDWIADLNRGDYTEAATHFAPNALVDQGQPFRLRNGAAARRFNASLPCRADLIDVEDEGERLLASFRLRRGPGGPCEGVVKVRFAFSGKRFSEFRQLPGEEARPGEVA